MDFCPSCPLFSFCFIDSLLFLSIASSVPGVIFNQSGLPCEGQHRWRSHCTSGRDERRPQSSGQTCTRHPPLRGPWLAWDVSRWPMSHASGCSVLVAVFIPGVGAGLSTLPQEVILQLLKKNHSAKTFHQVKQSYESGQKHIITQPWYINLLSFDTIQSLLTYC